MEVDGKMDKKAEEALLKSFVQSTGKTIEELRPLLEKAKQEAKEANQANNEDVIKGKFRRKIDSMLYFERTGQVLKRKEPVVFKGFLFGADRIRDLKENMRRRALREAEENFDEAKAAGYIDENGTPIDHRSTVKNRRGEEVDNPDFHKPIVGNQFVRDVFGIVKTENDKTPKLFVMSLWRGFASAFRYRPFTPIQFKCTIKTEGKYLVLNSPRLEKGEKLFKAITMPIDYEGWIRTAIGERKYELDDMDRAVKDTKSAIDPWVMLEGLVDNISPDINPKTDSRRIILADPDSGKLDVVYLNVPKDFPLAFREYSRVIALGRPSKWEREDESIGYSLNAVGVYPLPGHIVEAKVEIGGRSAAGEEETEEGWDIWEG